MSLALEADIVRLTVGAPPIIASWSNVLTGVVDAAASDLYSPSNAELGPNAGVDGGADVLPDRESDDNPLITFLPPLVRPSPAKGSYE
jgi:hypothetical protein